MLEIEKAFLYDVQEQEWERLKTLVGSSIGLLWLTRGRETDPKFGLATGLGRGLLSEFARLQFIELALEKDCTDELAASHIKNIIKNSTSKGPIDQRENEYEEKDGILRINRVIQANYLNNYLAAKFTVQQPRQQQLQAKPDCGLSLTIRNPGLLNTLHFEEVEVEKEPLEADEVEIQVQAVGANFKDVMIALGQIPANSLGLEFSGVVLRAGSDVGDELKAGDRVCGIARHAFSTKLRTGRQALFKIPDSISFTTAAAIPLSFCIAYHGLMNLANLSQGDRVLIHSGAGGVGQAAIQLAVAAGAEIYCTVGSDEKKEFLSSLYPILANRIFVSKGDSFIPALKKVVDGVDVILNSLTGQGLRQTLGCIRPFGRFIDISQGDNRALDDLPGMLLAQNITYSTIDLALILEKSKSLTSKIITSVYKLLENSQIKAPSPVNIYKASQFEDAFRHLQAGKNIGKTVVQMNEDDIVPVMPSVHSSYNFHAGASYVIVGGLGGLGKSTARWMADRGAKNLILLGRSGAKNKAALDFLEEMRERNVSVAAPPCDVSDEEALRLVLETCFQTMPPIKGCIQGSMVNRVCVNCHRGNTYSELLIFS